MDKRQIIINAAIKRFRHYGVFKTTMNEIAKDAGMAVGTLYLYFKNKGDIVKACADIFGTNHKIQANEILNSEMNNKEKLKTYIFKRFIESKSTRQSSEFDIEITDALLKYYPERLEEEGRWMYENLLSILKDGINKKEFYSNNPEKDIEVLLYSLNYFFPLARENQKEPEEEKLADLIDWFINLWSLK